MAKINKKIEIVSSLDTSLSSMSRESREAIHDTLSARYKHVSITLLKSQRDIEELVARNPDVVFIGIKYIKVANAPSGKLWVSEYLSNHGIAHTGSSYSAHMLEAEKTDAKKNIHASGLKTAKYVVITQDSTESFDYSKLDYPVFIKPSSRGGGLGVDEYSIAHNAQDAALKVKSLHKILSSDALVETYLNGREFSVSLLKDDTGNYQAMPLELVAWEDSNGDRMLSQAVKNSNEEQVLEVAHGQLRIDIIELAKSSFASLDGRDYGRIDIRLDSKGVPHFLEANLIPSLIAGYGSFPKACEIELGLNYTEMIQQIVDMAFTRQLDFEDTSDDLIAQSSRTIPYSALI